MIKNQKGFTGLEVVLLVIVTALLVGGGVYVYTKRSQPEAKQTASVPAPKSETKTTENADEAILKAADCNHPDLQVPSTCKIEEKTATLANVVISGDGGSSHIFLAKENGKWKIIFEGNGDVPASVVQKYNIPESWLGPQL